MSSPDGFNISGLRLLEWLFGTPVMIVLAKQLYALSREPPVDYVGAAVKLFERHRGADGVYIPPPSARLVQADVFMIVCGCFIANLAPAPPAVRNGALVAGVAAFVYVISHLSRCLAGSTTYSAIAGVRKDAKFGYALAVFNVVSWCVFPTAYFLHVSGRIDAARLDLGYAIGDAFAKFSCTMLYVTSCGRIMDLAEDEAARRTDAQVAEHGEYIRAVCAELKEPLDAIVGYGRMSADYDESGEKTPSQVRRFQRAILTSAESMRELVSQAAQYSKVHGEIHARGRMMTGKEGEDVGPRVAWRKEGGDSRAFPLPPMLPTPVEGSAASAASPSTGTTRRTRRAAFSRWVSSRIWWSRRRTSRSGSSSRARSRPRPPRTRSTFEPTPGCFDKPSRRSAKPPRRSPPSFAGRAASRPRGRGARRRA